MITARSVNRYGWIRDIPDPRDRIFNLEHTISQASQLPLKCTLRQEMPPIYDQGQLGSCTANADAGIFEHQQIKQGEGTTTPSRLFIYYEERRVSGLPVSEDTGAEVRDGIKVLVTEGAPPESMWPYDDSNPGRFQERPPQSAYTDAVAHETLAYKRILLGSVGAPMRSALYQGYPIAFGFPVPASFESLNWDPATEYLQLPTSSTRWIGGHAVVVVGYDFSCTEFSVPVFEVRNSWGPDWGDNGHFYMHYHWFKSDNSLANDLWVITQVK